MIDDIQRLEYIVTSVAYAWSYFTSTGEYWSKLESGSPQRDIALGPLIQRFELLFGQRTAVRGAPEELRSEITISAVLRMQIEGRNLQQRKRAALSGYSDQHLQLYAADFIMRAYFVASQKPRSTDSVVITDEVVVETVADLPQDWPTDWWLNQQNVSELLDA